MAQLLRTLAEADPSAIALVDERHGPQTFGELNARVDRLVHVLRTAGLQPGDTFAVMTGNQREHFEANMAAVHGGWRFVPVNWHWVADELAYVLEDSGSRALVVDERWLPVALDAVGRDGIDLLTVLAITDAPPAGTSSYEEALAAAPADEPTDQASGGPMFYTSGTTGFPKGVRSTISSVGGPVEGPGAVAAAARGMLGLPDGGVALLCGPAYHSAQWAFSTLPLLGGATVVMQHHFDPAEALRLIDENGVTSVHLVPTQMVRMLKLPQAVRDGFDGSSLKVVYHGAAPCPPEVKRRMLEWWGPVVWEYYGGTEGGFVTTTSPEEWQAKPGTVGKPLPIMEVLVTDDDGNRLGTGEVGQLWVRNLLGSDFEYHNAPEKTAAAHLEPGVVTLGDVGYVDEDGYVFLADRKIDMIISGGVNIYPAEIEGVLVDHPAVADAAVFGIPDEDFGEQVKAAIELVEGTEPTDVLLDEIRSFSRQHLAGYKVPRTIDVHAHLPRNLAGKLEKRKLRAPYWEGTGRSI